MRILLKKGRIYDGTGVDAFVGDILVYGIDGENLADVPHKLKEWRELINA